MDGNRTVLIFGASARAAAFSALRAGFRPWCVDLFADADLRQRVPVMRLPGRYPDAFGDLIDVELPGPWMYTSGLENRPFLVRKMARCRTLWGNDQPALVAARSPFTVAAALQRAGLAGPAVWGPGTSFPAVNRRWLIKPLAGAGGNGIRVLAPDLPEAPLAGGCYLQEFLEGESRSAVFVADGRSAQLIGVTRQLVGEDWLHASRFHYCGSIGPLPLTPAEAAHVQRVGDVLAAACGLRGLFGVDGIWRHGLFWPVEVNPRYTASVEVLEFSTGRSALARHVQAFQPKSPAAFESAPTSGVVGKAVHFARAPIASFPEGEWSAVLSTPPPAEELPPFADIPPAGSSIDAGHPVLTIFARAATVEDCAESLRTRVADVERQLYSAR